MGEAPKSRTLSAVVLCAHIAVLTCLLRTRKAFVVTRPGLLTVLSPAALTILRFKPFFFMQSLKYILQKSQQQNIYLFLTMRIFLQTPLPFCDNVALSPNVLLWGIGQTQRQHRRAESRQRSPGN